MRREWIEISYLHISGISRRSPSMRREWIEIFPETYFPELPESPSMRREWIEITENDPKKHVATGLPPCGGSGLKWLNMGLLRKLTLSPSMRREWIEISISQPKVLW